MFKKLAFLALVMLHTSASATLMLNLDGNDYSLLTAVLDTDDNELRVNTGVELFCSGGTPPAVGSVTLTFIQAAPVSFALDSVDLARVLDVTEINALSINQDISCNPDPGEDIFFLDGFEGE